MLITELHVEFGNMFTDVTQERKTPKYQFSLNKLSLRQMDRIIFKDPQSGKLTFQLRRIFTSHICLNKYTLTHKTCVFLGTLCQDFSVMVR